MSEVSRSRSRVSRSRSAVTRYCGEVSRYFTTVTRSRVQVTRYFTQVSRYLGPVSRRNGLVTRSRARKVSVFDHFDRFSMKNPRFSTGRPEPRIKTDAYGCRSAEHRSAWLESDVGAARLQPRAKQVRERCPGFPSRRNLKPCKGRKSNRRNSTRRASPLGRLAHESG
jgi:hypothetical protein